MQEKVSHKHSFIQIKAQVGDVPNFNGLLGISLTREFEGKDPETIPLDLTRKEVLLLLASIKKYMDFENKQYENYILHCCGRNKTDDEAFFALKQIMETGFFKPSSCPIFWENGLENQAEKDALARIEGSGLKFEMVCFTDINVENISTHIRNFGKFGVALKKTIALEKEIYPVFYVAESDKYLAYHKLVHDFIDNTKEKIAEKAFVDLKKRDIFIESMNSLQTLLEKFWAKCQTMLNRESCEWRWVTDGGENLYFQPLDIDFLLVSDDLMKKKILETISDCLPQYEKVKVLTAEELKYS